MYLSPIFPECSKSLFVSGSKNEGSDIGAQPEPIDYAHELQSFSLEPKNFIRKMILKAQKKLQRQ